MRQRTDTIAAIATPPGTGGIGIIRISGPAARSLLQHLFTPSRPPAGTLASHRLYHGWLRDPATGRTLDEVLAVYMAAPHSYTREDVVEIHCHSSYLILTRILETVIAAGARPADPGEFTKRAFLNGRIDLTRAEAVLDLLQARTDRSLDLAVEGLAGSLHQAVTPIRDALLDLRALLEVAIDFPDEEVEIADHRQLAELLARQVVAPLTALIASGDQGRIYREGLATVILGRPNVGKSSLLNALLREERAIVTDIPGTTRDTIEEYLDIRGVPVRIVDTAGIRRGAGTVEEMGIQRARRRLAQADLVLLVLDAGEELDDEDEELLAAVAHRPHVLVANKVDRMPPERQQTWAHRFASRKLVFTAAPHSTGLADLEAAIFAMATQGQDLAEGTGVSPNQRQKAVLSQTLAAAQTVAAGLDAGLSPDLLVVDVQAALDHLAELTGDATTDDVLDRIFSRFCIGK